MGKRTHTPLLKWPGGKRSILDSLLPLIPETYGHYYEPFFGGGALFFKVQPTRATLSDLNPDLINCYIQVRDQPNLVIAGLGKLSNSKADYYLVRNSIPNDDVARAVRMLYLTRFSFNGLYRLNLKGQFNVPYGFKTHLTVYDEDVIRTASTALKNTTLKCGDFEQILETARAGDLVYLDPPYTVAHGNNGFIKYNEHIFSWKDQCRLAKVAADLSSNGCTVIVSNADHPTVRSLYEQFNLRVVSRTSRLAALSDRRRTVTECIFHNR